MEATLKQIWDGWAYLRTPDNLEITLTFEGGYSLDVFAAVLDLIELYEYILERTPREVMIGTGDIVELQFDNGRVIFILNEQHEEAMPYSELKGLFENLLRETFDELDKVGSARTRRQEFEHHPEAKTLYERFSG